MSDSRGRAFLQKALALDPTESAPELLAARREFLHPDEVVQAEFAGGTLGTSDFRTRQLLQLATVRRNFWTFHAWELKRRLEDLQAANHPEIAPAVARLTQVATQRETLFQLHKVPAAHPAFVLALSQILIAPAAEANRLRERELSYMRPEQNPQYEGARQAVQVTARMIAQYYPALFELEEGWLTEILEYNPKEETRDSDSNAILGLSVLALGAGTVVAFIMILMWVFS
jgi:hypothetical protein